MAWQRFLGYKKFSFNGAEIGRYRGGKPKYKTIDFSEKRLENKGLKREELEEKELKGEKLREKKGQKLEEKEITDPVMDNTTRSWANVAGGGGNRKENSSAAVGASTNSTTDVARESLQPPHQNQASAPSPHPHPQPEHHRDHRGPYKASEYRRPAEQTPHTGTAAEEEHYIVTLATSADLHKEMTRLRDIYFPHHLNHLEAHIALFRALPGSQIDLITSTLSSVCASTSPFDIAASAEPQRMRMGFLILVAEGRGKAETVYRRCEGQWKEFLSEQDRGCKPHWTVMNKEKDDGKVTKAVGEVRKKLEEGGCKGRAEGCCLWLYEGSKWKFVKRFDFGGGGGGV